MVDEVVGVVPEANPSREPYLSRLDLPTLLLLVLVFYVPNQLHFPAELGVKGLNVLNLLLIATAVVLVTTTDRGVAPPPLTGYFIAFWVVCGVAVGVGQTFPGSDGDLSASLTELKSVITYTLLYFVFYYGAHDRPTVRLLFLGILFVALVASLETLREGLDYGTGHYSDFRRAAGPFGRDFSSSNRAGVFLAVFLPQFLAISLFYRGSRLVRLAALGCFGLGILGAFQTYSRQSYICLSVAVVLLMLRRSLLFAVPAFLLIASYSVWAPETVVTRLSMTNTTDEQGQVQLDPSVANRHEIWADAMRMLADHPAGVGLARFKQEMSNYTRFVGLDAHNQYVLIASETGLQGIATYLFLLIGLALQAVRLVWRSRTDEDRVLSSAFGVALISLVAGSVYGSPVFMGEVTGNFWALAALASRWLRLNAEADDEEE